MIYRNKITGAIVETECECSGENWTAEKSGKPSPKGKTEPKEKAVKADATG